MSCYRWKCQWLSDFSRKHPDGILSQSTCLFKTVLERLSLSDTVIIYIIPQQARIVFSSTELALLRRGFSNLKCPQTITLQINVATSQDPGLGLYAGPVLLSVVISCAVCLQRSSVVSCHRSQFPLQNHWNTEIMLPTEALSGRIREAIDIILKIILRIHNPQIRVV